MDGFIYEMRRRNGFKPKDLGSGPFLRENC